MGKMRNYIGNLFEIETKDENSKILLFDGYLGSRQDLLDNNEQDELNNKGIETGFLKIDIENNQIEKLFGVAPDNEQELIDKWFEIILSSNSEDPLICMMFTDLGNELGTLSHIASFSIIGTGSDDDKLLEHINSLLDLTDIYNNTSKKIKSTIRSFKEKIKGIDSKNINVISYNVGQGNAIGIFHGKTPLFYFDLGGGAYWNKKTYRDVISFPIDNNPFIILSHWDFDHYESLRSKIEHYNECTIIAPLQKITPSAKKLADKLKNLILIDQEFNNGINCGFFEIFRCSGWTKNDTGIGISIDLKKENDISKILLPGDAQYCFIEKKYKTNIDAICVSHHGGKICNEENFPISTEKDKGFCVYSYGKGNVYGHPLNESKETHKEKGWGNNSESESEDEFNSKDGFAYDTTLGDVMYRKYNPLLKCRYEDFCRSKEWNAKIDKLLKCTDE
ncbi:MAG: hypothetical protein H6Q15_1113 [Bacteroidetes bacterium]|nr:hypothetical protein [Bacteroidota bacterium]